MANRYLEQQIKYQKQIEKLQERIVYFSAISSLIGCTIGTVCGYMIGKESVQPDGNQMGCRIISQAVPSLNKVQRTENSR